VIPYAVQPIRARGSLAANCFAVHRKHLDSSLKFHFQDLTGQRGSITAIEFSYDGTLLASGSHDKAVRLWPIRNAAEGDLVILFIGGFVFSLIRSIHFFVSFLKASIRLQDKMLQAVVRSPLLFFDRNPIGIPFGNIK